MGKPDNYRSSSRDRSRGRDEDSHRYRSGSEERRGDKKYKEKKKYGDEENSDIEKERKKREKAERKERERREKEGGHGRSSSRPQSRERERGFPGEHGYGRYQESQGWGERPNIQTYGHPGYGAPGGYEGQPQTYQTSPPPPPPPGGAYGQDAYGTGQGVYAYQPTSPPPVQYQPSAYQQPAYGGGGGYSGSYQTGPTPPPPAGFGGAYNQGYPPPQTYGYHSNEYRPQEKPPAYSGYQTQEQPAAYGGYPPPAQPGNYGHEQGSYSQGYQPPPGPPPGTPSYHSPPPPQVSPGFHPPPPNPHYGAPSPVYGAAAGYGVTESGYPAPPKVTAGGATAGQSYKPQHHSAQQQQQENQGSNQYGTPISYSAPDPAVQSTANLNPANLSAKPPAGGFAVSALSTFTTGLNSALHGYARTLFPATSTHKPTTQGGVPSGDSGAPAQTTENRFDSFAPVRGGNGAKWYVDGKDYMYAVSIAIERAQKSIWIMDWWLSPELYLRRPPALNEEYRIDRMLKAAAARGVHINIIVYKEVTQALTRKSLKPLLTPYISSLLSKATPSSSKPLSFLSAVASNVALPLAFHGLEKLEAKYPLLYPSDADGIVTVSSHHTKTSLEGPNISVFRHPDHLPDRPTIQNDIFKKLTTGTYTIGDGLKGLYGMKDGVVLYWAHHEKLCLIDGEIAFMGGLDLCFGRWDMNHHPIADAHPNDINQIVFPGQDFNNARFMDFHTVDHWDQNKVSRTDSSRMGWTDVALSIIGPAVKDLQRHFFDRWNFIYNSKYKVRNEARFQPLDERFLQGPGYHREKIKHKMHGVGRVGRAILEGADPSRYEGEQEARAYGHETTGRFEDLAGVQCQIVRSASKWSHDLPATEHSIAHAYIEIITAAKHFVYIENQFFITATDDKQSPIINKIGRAIVDRILRAARERQKFRIIVIMPAVPAFAGDLQAESSLGTRAIMEFQYRSINNDKGFSIMEQIANAGVDPKQYIRFYNLRSYDRINANRAMDQAQQASGVGYNAAAAGLDSRVGGGYNPGSYGVQGDEYARYQQAAPGGSSEWDSVAKCSMLGGGDIRQVPWNGDPAKEIDAFVSEELYIHSKLLIADDCIVICGSANLNDRSQLGDHDSEIAIIIDDPTPLPSSMNGIAYQASHFAATLRRQIFRKHLGLIPAQNLTHLDENMEPVPVPNIYDFDSAEDRLVADPLSEQFWEFWNYTAKTNTDAFGKAFHVVPHDSVKNWKQYDEWWSKWFVPSKEENARVDKINKEKKPPTPTPPPAPASASACASGKTPTGTPGPTDKAVKPEGEKPKPLIEWGHVVKAEFSEGAQGVRELKELLSRIRGHLVEMPLEFLKEEDIAKEGLELNALTETIYT